MPDQPVVGVLGPSPDKERPWRSYVVLPQPDVNPEAKFTSGKFSVESRLDSFPMWAILHYGGETLAFNIHHQDLKDLAEVIERLRKAMHAAHPKMERD